MKDNPKHKYRAEFIPDDEFSPAIIYDLMADSIEEARLKYAGLEKKWKGHFRDIHNLD